jgi:hypothetical protein
MACNHLIINVHVHDSKRNQEALIGSKCTRELLVYGPNGSSWGPTSPLMVGSKREVSKQSTKKIKNDIGI